MSTLGNPVPPSSMIRQRFNAAVTPDADVALTDNVPFGLIWVIEGIDVFYSSIPLLGTIFAVYNTGPEAYFWSTAVSVDGGNYPAPYRGAYVMYPGDNLAGGTTAGEAYFAIWGYSLPFSGGWVG